MKKRSPSGVMAARKLNPKTHKPKAIGPSYLAQESEAEFVPEIKLIKATDVKPRYPWRRP
uniref:hypothetical protein n=1 Tax=Methylobacterium sp. B34 TaxID=95563 RepID=UPI00034709CB|nr:hypothetical protein [Methylobacterium sp. B34]